jgi:ribosomal-protein-serine acetyltransferase
MFEHHVDDEIKLRLLAPRHADALFSVVDSNRQHLRLWLPWLDANVAVSDTLHFIQATQRQFVGNAGFTAGVWYCGELAGIIGHNRIDWESRISWLGYWLAEGFQGKGIMTKSCRTLVNHAFTELNLNRIDIRCAVGNSKSRAIPERLGFQQEGVIREAEWLYDRFVDHIVYGLLKSQWQSGSIATRR